MDGYNMNEISTEQNNNAATAMEEMMSKMQEMQEKYNRLKARQAVTNSIRETEDESDFELQDPFGSGRARESASAMVMGSPTRTAYNGPPGIMSGIFASRPFDATNNLNLGNPNIRENSPPPRMEVTNQEANTTPTPPGGGDDSSDSECQ